jgi:hypothetical protein
MALKASSPKDADILAGLGYKGFIYPVDEALGIAHLPFNMTVGAMLRVAKEACLANSYEEAESNLKEINIKINDDTIRAVTNLVGALVFNNEKKAADLAYAAYDSGKWERPEPSSDDALYLEVDGAMVPTRKNKEDGANQPEIAQDSDDPAILVSSKNRSKKSFWRENKLAMAFSTDNFFRWTDIHGKKRHQIRKRDYTAYIGQAKEFNKFILALAIRNGYGFYRRMVIISDGATWIREMKKDYFPDAQQILDYWHLCENVSEFFKKIFNQDASKYEPLTAEICALLKNSQPQEAISKIRSLGKRLLSRTSQNLVQYIENNIDNIDYATYQAQGYFIGSGAIESSNKIVVQRRLKQAGMRWNLESAQNVVTLEAKLKSGLWEQEVAGPLYRHYNLSPGRTFVFQRDVS